MASMVCTNGRTNAKMTGNEEDTFCKKMRKATKQVHTISDSLVNAKLAFGFLDDSVWADSLLVFYEVFRNLELAIDRQKHTEIGSFPLDELRRTEAFERDLEFYLGKDWRRKNTARESVTNYLRRLREVENTEPILLTAYIYHLYMGLLSGGIILRKKRQLMRTVWPFGGHQSNSNNITNFENTNIFQLKRRIRDTMNDIADTLDEHTKRKLIEESKMVFALNNEIIKSVRNVGVDLLKKVLFFLLPVILLLFLFISPFPFALRFNQ